MRARTDLAQRIQGLAVLRHVDTFQQQRDHVGLVGVHDELLVPHGQTAFQPACRMQHEVHSRQRGRLQGVGRFIRRLGVWNLRRAQSAAAAERHAQAARQLPCAIENQAGFRGAESRRSRLHRHGSGEGAEHDGRPGPDELDIGHARQRLGKNLCQRAGNGHRRHCSGEQEWRNDRCLVVFGIDRRRPQHGSVEGQRRICIDQARQYRFFLDKVLAEQELRHCQRVFGAVGVGDRTHERLVRVLDMAVNHVEVTLVDGKIDRLADRAPRMMQARRHVG